MTKPYGYWGVAARHAVIVVDLLNAVAALAIDQTTGWMYVAGANVICAFSP